MLEKQRIAFVDLAEGTVVQKDIPWDVTGKLLGGRGLNMFLLWKYFEEKKMPTDPKGFLFITPGLLTGTAAPCASRTSISGISPETGYLGDSNIGGSFGAALKQSGLDGIILSGRSKEPVLLSIDHEGIRIVPAEDCWGTNLSGFRENIGKKYGSGYEWIGIGRAGEKGVRYACIISGWKNAAGRTGMGCLMGSKLLKGIIIKKPQKRILPVSEKYRQTSEELKEKIAASAFAKVLAEYGTPYLYYMHNRFYQICRIHNGASEGYFDDGDQLSMYNLKEKYIGRKACYGCPVGCRHGYRVKVDGEEMYAEGPEYGMLGNFGPVCGIKDADTILKINHLLNDYGLDTCSTGNMISLLIHLKEQNIVSREMIGFDIGWGDSEAVIRLVEMIGNKEGIGSILAEGILGMEERFGSIVRDSFIGVKNLPQSDSVDVRNLPGFALGIATATRGADHLRSRPTFEILGLPKEEIVRLTGMKEDIEEESAEYKAWLVYWSEVLYAVVDAIGLCKFVSKFNNVDLIGFPEISVLLTETLGTEISEKDVFQIGECILAVERFMMSRLGLSRADDTLPSLYFKVLKQGRNQGKVIEKEFFEKMLDSYYSFHSWDRDGVPGEKIRKELEDLRKKCGEDLFE